MASILSVCSSFIQSALQWVSEIVDMVSGNPLLILFVVAIPICGLGIGLLRRLIG